MRFIAAGVGPGDPELITLKALRAVESSDLIVIPMSGTGKPSVAEGILGQRIGDRPILRIVFPMTKDREERDARLSEQIKERSNLWSGARTAVMTVLGDAALYATAAYLYDVWRRIDPSISLEIIPGVSAHSLVSARAGKFLVLGDGILSIAPGTANKDRIMGVLRASDTAAIFKPSAMRGHLRETAESTGPWREMARMDMAGLPGEKLFMGNEALNDPDEYLSTLLLWR
jgi:precorrin-2/cobalt-factor-2 C20-methyltransferase